MEAEELAVILKMDLLVTTHFYTIKILDRDERQWRTYTVKVESDKNGRRIITIHDSEGKLVELDCSDGIMGKVKEHLGESNARKSD